MRPALIACAAFWFAFLLACTSSPTGGNGAPPTDIPTPSPNLSSDEAIEIAIKEASHIIQDSSVQATTAEITSYGAAIAKHTDSQPFGPAFPSQDTGTWEVTLRGLFYPPPGPAPLSTDTLRPRDRSCQTITVLIEDSTGDFLTLIVSDADSCS